MRAPCLPGTGASQDHALNRGGDRMKIKVKKVERIEATQIHQTEGEAA